MPVDDMFVRCAPHTVTITPTATKNLYGEVATTGTVRTAKAYVDPTIGVRGGDHEEVTRPVTAVILDTAITTTDEITLPDGTTPEIASVAVYDSGIITGMEHTVVRFK